MSDWVLPLLVSAFPLLLVSAWTCVDESTVKSSAKAVDADNAPPPNIVAVAKISAATFLRPGFITLSFPSGECVMKTGEGLKRSPPRAFFDCSVISMESWSQVRFAGEFPRPAFRFLPAPTMLLPIFGNWLKHGFMSGRARLYLLFGFMGRFLLVRVGFGFGLGIGLTVGGFFGLACGLTFAKLLDGHGQ